MTALKVYADRLGDPNLGNIGRTIFENIINRSYFLFVAIHLKVTIANDLRDQVEVFQTTEYPNFLSTLIPVFLDILHNVQPVFISNAPEQVK